MMWKLNPLTELNIGTTANGSIGKIVTCVPRPKSASFSAESDFNDRGVAEARKLRKPYKYFAFFITAVIIVAIINVIIYFLVKNSTDSEGIPRGAVVTNGHTCSKIGASILDRGGTAVEATIAAMFCEGVSMPHSMGLGGGFLMTIYDRQMGTVRTLNAREIASAAANEDMFGNDTNLSTKGRLTVAVPGELRGYWEAYQMYGQKTPWKDLVQPTIDLCTNGILVMEYLAGLLSSQEQNIKKDPVLSKSLIDQNTGKALRSR